MTAFRTIVAARADAPPRVVTLAPEAWASTWASRPGEPVRVGLRRHSEGDARAVSAAAAGKAWRRHPAEEQEDERVEAYNAIVMALLVARVACDPDDASIGYWEAGAADDAVPMALTPAGIEYLYGEIDRMSAEDSQTAHEATDDEMAWLSGALASGSVWGSMSVEAVARTRRLLAYAIAQMGHQ